jgi:hypothetical protein
MLQTLKVARSRRQCSKRTLLFDQCQDTPCFCSRAPSNYNDATRALRLHGYSAAYCLHASTCGSKSFRVTACCCRTAVPRPWFCTRWRGHLQIAAAAPRGVGGHQHWQLQMFAATEENANELLASAQLPLFCLFFFLAPTVRLVVRFLPADSMQVCRRGRVDPTD